MTNASGHTVDRYIIKPQSVRHCMNVSAWTLENYAGVTPGHYEAEAIIGRLCPGACGPMPPPTTVAI